MEYTWDSLTNSFDGYTPQYETKTDENGNETEVLIEPTCKIWTEEEVKALFESRGKDQAIKDVDGTPTIVNLYTDKELALKSKHTRIAECKALLKATDYQAIKFAEGELTAEEYAPMKAQRILWRDEINACENYINACETE